MPALAYQIIITTLKSKSNEWYTSEYTSSLTKLEFKYFHEDVKQ